MTHAFICDGIGTPFGRHGGALSSMRADDLLAGLLAGPPVEVAGLTVNRLSASGTPDVVDAARAIASDQGDPCIGVWRGLAALLERVQ